MEDTFTEYTETPNGHRDPRTDSYSGPEMPKSARVKKSPADSQRLIASYAAPRAYAPRVRAALASLGYRITPASTRGPFDDDSWEPDLRIVDERYMDRIPPEDYLPRTPVVLLTAGSRAICQDRRVVGSVTRPATLKDLYPVLQRALEDTPRTAARAPTQLPARCTQSDRRWLGAIISLSHKGCLFRTNEPLANDEQLNLLFPLRMGEMVSARVRVIGQQGQSVRMLFDEIAASTRDAVAQYVADRLATL